MLIFVEERKPKPQKNPWSKKGNQQQTQPTYDNEYQEFNPSYIGGKEAVLHHSFSLNKERSFKKCCLKFFYDAFSESQFLLICQNNLQSTEKITVLLRCISQSFEIDHLTFLHIKACKKLINSHIIMLPLQSNR